MPEEIVACRKEEASEQNDDREVVNLLRVASQLRAESTAHTRS